MVIKQQFSLEHKTELASWLRCALLIVIACLTILLSHTANAITTLRAEVDRNPAMAGETFILNVVADDSVNRNTLDTKALLKDFIVGQTSVSSNTQILNGSMSQQTTWRVALIARNPGDYTIPSLTVDGISSQPIAMKIIPQTQSAQENQEVKLDATISATTSYIGQPLIYTIKLYIGTRLQRANLQEPSLIGADVVQMGEDTDASEIVNGKRYRTITRRYSISPTQAGTFDLQGSIFRGDISQYGYGRSKPVTLLANNETITVKPIPTDFPGQWLASEIVTIEDDWEQQETYRVGEPITRTITLSAANIATEQLPDLTIDNGTDVQSYPDKPELKTGFSGNTLISQVIQKLALIPSKAGTVTLPEIKVPWFNVSTERVEWATIAAKTITVAPANQTQQQVETPIQQPQQVTPPQQQTPQVVSVAAQLNIIWPISVATLALLVILLGIYSLKLRTRLNSDTPAVTKSVETSTASYATLIAALEKNDVGNVMKLLPLWLNSDFNLRLSDPVVVDSTITEHYERLAGEQYSKQPQTGNCQALKQSVITFMKNYKVTTKPSLDGLYKN
ncbi:BatD family protein [Psychrobium sp. MM17-31]|uniref:BatD family protein n=1 Tax=Psychrobium sp. MM17-31 TaxID=2917758 RepID=UPI001EF50F21|nr:BatD family protein [Psychrobium sp. MM17-31]